MALDLRKRLQVCREKQQGPSATIYGDILLWHREAARLGAFQASMGKWRRPCPINRHALSKDAGG